MKIAFALLFLFAAGVLVAVDKPETPSNEKIKSLKSELIETLKASADAAEILVINARLSPIEAARAQHEYAEALLEAAESKEERMTILKSSIEICRNIEAMAVANQAAAKGTLLETLKAKASRIKLEIALEKEKPADAN